MVTSRASWRTDAWGPRTAASWGASSRATGLLNGLHVGGGIALSRAKKAAAALRFASSMPMASIEFDLMQHMRDRSVAGPIRAVAGRIRDVIEAVITICRVRGAIFAEEDRVGQIGVRLEIGLPAELGSLASQLGTSLTRTSYLNLLNHGISTPDQIRSLSDEELDAIVGSEAAKLVRQALEPS
jgi:helicase